MAICKLVVILGVFVALFDHGASRGFTGNYQQAAMIQKASKITEVNEPLVIGSKRFPRSEKSREKREIVSKNAADCDDEESGEELMKRSRRVPENPNLAEAIVKKISDDHLEAEEEARDKRVKGSYSASKFVEKLTQKMKGQKEAQTDKTAGQANESKDKDISVSDEGVSEIARLISALLSKMKEISQESEEASDDMKRALRNSLQNLATTGEDQSMAEKVEGLLAAASQASRRMKRQTVEDVEKPIERALSNNQFISGHYSKLGLAEFDSGVASVDSAKNMKKRSVSRRRNKRSRAVGYKAMVMAKQHGRSVKDIIHA